jgi:hypothetical protein
MTLILGMLGSDHVEFVVDKAARGHVSSEYFGFSYQAFHRFFHFYYNPSLSGAVKIGQ